jgi:hypothetical protein
VVTGHVLHVRLSGTPPPRALILKDADQSFRLLWPLPGDARAGPRDVVEIDLQASPPAGRLTFIALFGSDPLPDSRALEMARALERRPEVGLPDGLRSARRCLRILAR